MVNLADDASWRSLVSHDRAKPFLASGACPRALGLLVRRRSTVRVRQRASLFRLLLRAFWSLR